MTNQPARPGPRFTAILFVVALAVRLVWLGRDDVWSDEVHTLEFQALPAGELVREVLAAGHLPVYYLLLKAWTGLVGTSQFAIRLPSAVFGALAVLPAVGLFGRLLDRRAAAWAAALFAFHPLLLELSREARMYSLLVLCLVTVLEGVVVARDEGRLPIRFWVAVAVGPFVHATWGLGLAATGAWLWWERRAADERTRAGGQAFAGIAASALVLVASLAVMDLPQHALVRREHWWEEGATFLIRLVAGAGVTRAHVALYGAFAVVWAWVAFEGWRVLDPCVRRLAALFVVGVPLLSLVAWGVFGGPWGPVRYVAAVTLGIALVGGAGAARPKGPGLILAGLLVAVIGVRFVPARVHWSQVAGTLVQAAEPSDVIRTPDLATAIVLTHYLRLEDGNTDHVHAEFVPEGTPGYWCACRKAVPQSPHWQERPDAPDVRGDD